MNSYQFFLSQAGSSHNPEVETAMQGRIRGARALALSERKARDAGCSFEWQQDDCDSSEWSDEEPAWAQWVCIMRDENGKVLETVGGVDFGRDRDPWMDSYRRVVEAELALEHFAPACFR